MKSFFVRRASVHAWLGLFALALLASVVVGRVNPPQMHTAPQAGATQSREVAALAHDDFDLARLRRQLSDEPVRNLFPVPAPAPAPPAPAPVVQVVRAPKAPAPTVPPLPLRYLGRAIEDGRTTFFIARGKELHMVREGDLIGDDYWVSDITASEMTFTYLPLDARQALAIPNAEPIVVQ